MRIGIAMKDGGNDSSILQFILLAATPAKYANVAGVPIMSVKYDKDMEINIVREKAIFFSCLQQSFSERK